MTRRLSALAAGAALVSLVAGCGIPAQTEVQVDGPVATPLSGPPGGQGNEPPPRRATDDPGQFVVNYLKAAAGETSGAYERAKMFIAPEDREQLRERQGNEVTVNIVRIADQLPVAIPDADTNRSKVTIMVQQVGVLHADGTIAPPLPTAPTKYTFIVGQVPSGVPGKDDGGLYLFKPPDVLLMSTTALKTYYDARTIYFWSGAEKPILVPDRRYLANSVPAERQATEVLGWLIGGPPDWLRSTVRPLPDGTKVVGNVPQSEGRLEVPLSAPAGSLNDDGEVDRLVSQLAWSLFDFHGTIELKIRNQIRRSVDADEFRRKTKPAAALGESPQRYCVSAGSVRLLTGQGLALTPDLINTQHNRNVLSAGAVRTAGSTSVALVTATGNRRRLQTGTGPVPVATSKTSARSYGSMGRPVWLKGTDLVNPVGLVVADRKLNRFDTEARLTPVAGVAEVTAVGVSFDGRRLAFAAGDGGLYVASLAADGGVITVGPARRLAVSLRSADAVDWMSEDSLVVAGKRANGQSAVYAVMVDGTEETDLQFTGGRVTHVVGYPGNQVMVEANGLAWDYRFSRFESIQPNQVVGGAGTATAPFFLY